MKNNAKYFLCRPKVQLHQIFARVMLRFVALQDIQFLN